MSPATFMYAFSPAKLSHPLLRVACAITALTSFACTGLYGVQAACITTCNSVDLAVHRAGNSFSIRAAVQNDASHAVLLVYVHPGGQVGANSCASNPAVEAALVGSVCPIEGAIVDKWLPFRQRA